MLSMGDSIGVTGAHLEVEIVISGVGSVDLRVQIVIPRAQITLFTPPKKG